eukprot:GHVL01002988.1.p1 GENE.GHVL01002988.1~~GHVL01002988.1.p1  ORF type:complete len:171 (-),score=29.48 GHVL01002988.1:52-564(-)
MRNICLIIYIYVVCTYAATASGPRGDVANKQGVGTVEGGIPQINFGQLVSSLNELNSGSKEKCMIRSYGKLPDLNLCYTLMNGDKGVNSFISLLNKVSKYDGVFEDVDEMKRIMDLSTEYEELIMTDFLALSHYIVKRKLYYKVNSQHYRGRTKNPKQEQQYRRFEMPDD